MCYGNLLSDDLQYHVVYLIHVRLKLHVTEKVLTNRSRTVMTRYTMRLTGRQDLEAGGPCRKQADVLFMIDTTSNMDYDYFQQYMLGFVNDVIQQLDVDTGRTRVAVVSFSDSAQVRRSNTVIDFVIDQQTKSTRVSRSTCRAGCSPEKLATFFWSSLSLLFII